MLRGQILCQALSSKLEIFNLTENLASVRRLERVLVAKRILVKKLAIMSKEKSTKIRDTVILYVIFQDKMLLITLIC